MLKIERDKKAFVTLAVMPLADAKIRERYDLQEYICNSPDAFFAEIGQKLFLIAKEVTPSDTVQDRIDLLAVDQEGQVVIIELKRGNDKFQLLQAISYAGMVAHWEPEDFLRLLDENRRKALEEFLDVELDDINREQRIILIAEEYDYSVLVSAEWLSEKFGVDIMCCRIALAEDEPTKSEYLVCNIAFPAPELAGQAKRRGAGPSVPRVSPIGMTWGQDSVPIGKWKDLLRESVSRALQANLPVESLPMKKKTLDGTFNDLDVDRASLLVNEQLQISCDAGAVLIKKWVTKIRETLAQPKGFITVETDDGRKEDL